MRKLILTFILLGFLIQINAQSNRDQAIKLKNDAIELMDIGKINESLDILLKAQEIDPDYINVPYEIAYAYLLLKDYDKSIKIAKPLLKRKDVFDLVYQLIGNNYDLKGDKLTAIKYYDKGLKKFPNSGKLYLEKGVVIASQNKWIEALDVWEKGIVADPNHSSNYYYASQILVQTEEKIWGIYYGEIFLNLEPNTKRSLQISDILYNTYNLCLPINDNKWSLDFSKKATNIVFGGNVKDLKFSFETVHNLAMEKGYKNVYPVFNVKNLITIRKQFLKEWNDDYAERYPNIIFDYHNVLIKNNMFTSYFYWLLRGSSKIEFEKWEIKNNENYNNFLKWKEENSMNITINNKTNRFSYE